MRPFPKFWQMLLFSFFWLFPFVQGVLAQGRLGVRWALGGHSGSVYSVAYSPGGQMIATGGVDGTVKLWRSIDRTLIRTVVYSTSGGFGGGVQVSSVAFSPDGKTLASAGYLGVIKFWRVADGLALPSYSNTDGVSSLAYSPDGRFIAAGTNNKTVLVWRTSDGSSIATLTGHTGSVNSVAFSPDGHTLASGSSDKTIKFWDYISGGTLNTITTTHLNGISSIAYAADSKSIFSGGAAGTGFNMSDKTVKQWQLADNSLLQTFSGHTKGIEQISLSPDGKTLASASADQTVNLWRISNGVLLHTLAGVSGHTNSVNCVAFSPDGMTLASGSSDFSVKSWRVADGIWLGDLTRQRGTINSIAFSPDGLTLAVAAGDQSAVDNLIRLYRTSDGQLIRALAGHTKTVNAVAFSRDGLFLASASSDKTVKWWRVSDGLLMQTWSGHLNAVNCIAFSPDGLTLASGSADKTVKLYRISDRYTLLTINVGASVYAAAFSPDSQTIVTAANEPTVRFWRVLEGTQIGAGIQTGDYSFSFNNAVAYLDAQTFAVSGSERGGLWSIATGTKLKALNEYACPGAGFQLLDKTIFTGANRAATLQSWSVAGGASLRIYNKDLDAGVTALACSSNGRFLAYGLADGTVALAETAPATQTVLLQHSQSDALFAFRFTGTAFTSGTLVWSGFGQGLQVVATPDLDGDGTPDLLLQSAATGLLYTFLLNDPQTQIKAYGPLLENGLPIAALPHWRVAATPDLNRDGKSDLVLQNSVTGDVYYFLMDGRSILKQGFLSRGVNPDARLFAMPDLNGDGTPDALFQLGTTGNLYRWILSGDGTTIAAQGFVFTAGFAAWRAITAKETNGDGGVKVLFQNPANRAVYEWNLIGGDLAGYGYPSLDYPSGWTATGFFDVNRDGRDDVLFQNEATGSLYFYGLDGLTLLTNGLLYVDTIPHWKVVPQR